MKPIDFDAHYAQYAERWIRENMGKYKTIEQMEASLPEVYLRFLNRRADWLDGLTPGEYFARYESADALVALLRDYDREDVDVPDLLLERLVDLGECSIEPLMALARDRDAPEALRVIALNSLIELDTQAPLTLCLDLVDERQRHDDIADVAAELLFALGAAAVEPMLGRLERASEEPLCTYLDLLCNFPSDPRIYEYTVAQFKKDPTRRALFASYLGKIGDERALPTLMEALGYGDLNYLDYIEIKNAIERLGGEVPGPEPSFDGDAYYESLKTIE